ncbi:type II toxin-antitoxin system VapC family toxin [Candidatus Brocadia pituitae]|nr:type II toxin-antitoxin system VapC family toxin [Candidatus Brocadia pituitae]
MEQDRQELSPVSTRLQGFLPEDIATAQKLGELVQQYHVSGKQVHDANLVATMLVHGIHSLLTCNVDDFKRYKGLIKILLLEE